MSYKIITGANDAYILTLLNFLSYHVELGINTENIIVYDLGFNKTNLQKIKNFKNGCIEIKAFTYEQYPEHVNLNTYNGLYCSYAFKPIVIYNVAHTYNNIPIIWLDCACKITMPILNQMIKTIRLDGFYCPVGNYEKTIETIELNHPQTMSLIGITREQHFNKLQTRLACICGIIYCSFNGKTILDDWYKFSLDKNVIMPDGSSRNNHRQDQSVLSALMFLHETKYTMVFEKSTFNISCWNKCDKNTVETNYNKYGLFHLNNNERLGIIYSKTLDDAIQVYRERKQISHNNFVEQYYVLKL